MRLKRYIPSDVSADQKSLIITLLEANKVTPSQVTKVEIFRSSQGNHAVVYEYPIDKGQGILCYGYKSFITTEDELTGLL